MIIGGDEERQRRAQLQKSIMKASKKQEKRSANIYKGSRNAGSGSGWLRKNDVRTSNLLIENKLTNNLKSYSVKLAELNELHQRAVIEDRMPVLQFDLGGKHFVILTEDDFRMLIGADDE
jgi:hypothetical protein